MPVGAKALLPSGTIGLVSTLGPENIGGELRDHSGGYLSVTTDSFLQVRRPLQPIRGTGLERALAQLYKEHKRLCAAVLFHQQHLR
jgi:hypothetical protein